MATIMITGGTGLVGTRLTEMLIDKDHSVIILTRDAAKIKHRVRGATYVNWDIHQETIDTAAVSKADHIIHLAGAGVADKRWSNSRKKEIVESRTKSSALIVKALQEIDNHVQSVVSASAIGWYGHDTAESKQKGFREDALPDNDFLGQTCRLWEESIQPVTSLGKRLVILRTGIALSKRGGALDEFKKPLKSFVAAVLGDGKQIISWIHLDDLCRMYIAAIENKEMNGVYNAVAPDPVTNQTLTLSLAKKIKGNAFVTVHVPSFLLKIVLGEMSIEVLKSATVSSAKIESTGFAFMFGSLEKAIKDIA